FGSVEQVRPRLVVAENVGTVVSNPLEYFHFEQPGIEALRELLGIHSKSEKKVRHEAAEIFIRNSERTSADRFLALLLWLELWDSPMSVSETDRHEEAQDVADQLILTAFDRDESIDVRRFVITVLENLPLQPKQRRERLRNLGNQFKLGLETDPGLFIRLLRCYSKILNAFDADDSEDVLSPLVLRDFSTLLLDLFADKRLPETVRIQAFLYGSVLARKFFKPEKGVASSALYVKNIFLSLHREDASHIPLIEQAVETVLTSPQPDFHAENNINLHEVAARIVRGFLLSGHPNPDSLLEKLLSRKAGLIPVQVYPPREMRMTELGEWMVSSMLPGGDARPSRGWMRKQVAYNYLTGAYRYRPPWAAFLAIPLWLSTRDTAEPAVLEKETGQVIARILDLLETYPARSDETLFLAQVLSQLGPMDADSLNQFFWRVVPPLKNRKHSSAVMALLVEEYGRRIAEVREKNAVGRQQGADDAAYNLGKFFEDTTDSFEVRMEAFKHLRALNGDEDAFARLDAQMKREPALAARCEKRPHNESTIMSPYYIEWFLPAEEPTEIILARILRKQYVGSERGWVEEFLLDLLRPSSSFESGARKPAIRRNYVGLPSRPPMSGAVRFLYRRVAEPLAIARRWG
ncbi:MAG: hypothetical protein Q7T03_09845, partial [Deltaproteobacteria bacterium]|nr:hypothetical protein [Deltaproteobacteria bacterium]